MDNTFKIKAKRKNTVTPFTNVLLHAFFILMTVLCLYPVALLISISFSNELDILDKGYTLIPIHFSTYAYEFMFKSADMMIRAYILTIVVTVVATVLSTLLTAFYAYPLSRPEFRFRKQFMFFIVFTMLFNGGLVPWYIVVSKFAHLRNNFWVLIIPYLVNAFYIIIMRTFFKTTIPNEVIESCRIDGAGEWRTFFKIVLPLSLPALATIGLFTTLQYWNDYFLPLMYIDDPKLYNLQFLMYKLLMTISILQNTSVGVVSDEIKKLPAESVRMAFAVVSIGPIVIAYPFFQKYFIQGLTVGAVKG